MSQKKVDEYKNYKKNRRENIKKEKRKERLTMAAMWGAVVVFIACVGGAMGGFYLQQVSGKAGGTSNLRFHKFYSF